MGAWLGAVVSPPTRDVVLVNSLVMYVNFLLGFVSIIPLCINEPKKKSN